MAQYVFEGKTFNFPDDIPEEEAFRIMQADVSQSNEPSQAPQEAQQAPQEAVAGDAAVTSPDDALLNTPEPTTDELLNQEESAPIDPDSLLYDKTYMRAARIMHSSLTGQDFQGDDKELLDWSLDSMSQFNYNIASGAVQSFQIQGMKDEEKAAFGYVMEKNDNLEYTWAGAGRAAKAIAMDPTTYVGIGTFGIGLGAKAGGKILTKEAVKAMLRPQTARAAASMAAVEGAIWSGTSDAVRQSAERGIDPTQEYDFGRTAIATGIGAWTGGLIGYGAGKLIQGGAKAIPTGPETPNVGRLNLPEAQPLPPQTPPGTPSVMPETAKVMPDPNAPLPEQAVPEMTNPLDNMNLTPEARSAISTTMTRNAPIDMRAIADNFNPSSPAGEAAVRTAVKDIGEIRKVVDLEDFESAFAKVDPEGAIAGRVMDAVRAIAPDGTVANLPSSFTELNKLIKPVIDQLTQFNLRPSTFTDVIARAAASPEQATVIKASVNSAANLLTDVQTRLAGLAKAGNKEAADTLRRISPLQSALADLDSTMGSASGSELGFRANTLLTGENKGLSVENIMMEQGINPQLATDEQFLKANYEMAKRIETRKAEILKSKRMMVVEKNIDDALKAGDLEKALDYMDEADAVTDIVAESEGWVSKAKSAYNKTWDVFNEMAIAGALSPATLGINLAYPITRMMTMPAMQAIFRGAGEAGMREAVVNYATQLAASKRAFATARLFFKYEQQVFREAGTEVFEFKQHIPGKLGEAVRVIPRALGASDQMVRLMMYESEIAAEAAYDAVMKAKELKLKGKAKKEFINKTIEETMEKSKQNVAYTKETLDTIRKYGIKHKKLSGEPLRQYVKAELERTKHLWVEPTNKRVMDYVKVTTFGDELSDKGLESGVKWLDQRLNNEWKEGRTIAMFMRPTVKIFKGGTRITPGAQFLVKDFRQALTGSKGELAMVRAHMEMFMAYGMMMGGMALMANGALTGSGDRDFKKLRNMRDAGFDEYHLTLPGGFTFGYRNFDPISTPLKVTANFLEYLMVAQAERMYSPEKNNMLKKAGDIASAGVFAYIQAIKDANITQGMVQALTAIEDLFDPEVDGWQTGQKFIAEKLRTAWPGSFARIASNPLFGGDDVLEPRTFMQTMKARIMPWDESIPRSYDLLGNKRKMAQPGILSKAFGVDISTKKTLNTNYTEKEQAVVEALSRIERVTGADLTLPRKKEPFDEDLGTIETSEGISFRDAWNKEINSDPNLVNDLYAVLIERPDVPMGNKSYDGYAATRAKELLSAARTRAWERLVLKEFPAQDARDKERKLKWLTERGLLEAPTPLYSQ